MEIKRVAPRFSGAAVPGVVGMLCLLFARWMELGTLAFVVISLSTLTVIYVLLALLSRRSRRRGRLQQDYSLHLVAEAGVNGRAGMIRIAERTLEYSDKTGDHRIFRMSDLSQVRLSPIRLVRGTRMTLVGYDGTESEIAVTAPIEEVEQALTESAAT